MTPDQLPPPGPERDAEILLRLGETRPAFTDPPEVTIDRRDDGSCTVSGVPPYSTDPGACDRLVEEMVRRGWTIETRSSEAGTDAACWCEERVVRQVAHAPDRPDAVSAAALLALRGAS